MPKKKKANPLFLEFINHPHKGECAGCDPWQSVKYSLRNLFEKSDLLSCFVHADALKKAIKDFDLSNKKFIESIFKLWSGMRVFVNKLVEEQEKFPGHEAVDILEIFPELSFANIKPRICRNIGDGFGIDIVSVAPTDGSSPVPELMRIISSDLISFLLERYKPGIFAVCQLDGCERITLTANGKKYCCDSHKTMLNTRKKKKDLEYNKYKQIRDKLRQRYNRHPHKDKKTRENYYEKNWDEGKEHLYQKYYLDRHSK